MENDRRNKIVEWKLKLKTNPKDVFLSINTDEGRESFWAEQSTESNDFIELTFPNGIRTKAKKEKVIAPEQYLIRYFGSSVKFLINAGSGGGTILSLINTGIPENEYEEVLSGWVSVLMNLKAVLDHGVDLRNHDQQYSWTNGFVCN